MHAPLPDTQNHRILLLWLVEGLCEDATAINAQRLQDMALERLPDEERTSFIAKSNQVIIISAYKENYLRARSLAHVDVQESVDLFE
jgi:hypothetical protein